MKIRFSFDFKNGTADQLLRVIKNERIVMKELQSSRPLENVRENKVYTVKEDILKKITCDERGAYLNLRNVKTHYLVAELHGTLQAKKVHKFDNVSFLNKRQGQGYLAVPVEDESVHLIECYYRQNKLIPN